MFKLLHKEPQHRLGSGRGDVEDIKKHPFFNSIKWDDLIAKKIQPPFNPQVVSNFVLITSAYFSKHI